MPKQFFMSTTIMYPMLTSLAEPPRHEVVLGYLKLSTQNVWPNQLISRHLQATTSVHQRAGPSSGLFMECTMMPRAVNSAARSNAAPKASHLTMSGLRVIRFCKMHAKGSMQRNIKIGATGKMQTTSKNQGFDHFFEIGKMSNKAASRRSDAKIRNHVLNLALRGS